MNEIWKSIPGYEGYYEASSLGRIRSLARTCEFINRWGQPCERVVPAKILIPAMRGEYLASTLMKQGKKKRLAVHLWVLLAFKGPKPKKMDGCHNDGSRTNNCISNLRYDTRQGNFADKKLHGTEICGENNVCAKLNNEKVVAIRRANGSQFQIADMFGIDQTTVSNIRLRKTWRHI